MPAESKFYYPLQDEAAHLDRVFHDLVTISNDEDNAYKERITNLGEYLFVKGVINEDGYIHFIFDDVQSSRPIEVDEQEVPVGDGEDWVKPSDFFTSVGIYEYETTDPEYDIRFNTDDGVTTANYTFTQMQIVEDSETVDLLNEEFILSGIQIGSYKVQPLTSELINTMKSFFTNGDEFFSEHKYGYYCGSDIFNYAYNVTDKYYLFFDIDENDNASLVINKLTRSGNVVSLNTQSFSNIHIFVDLEDGYEFQATVNVNSKVIYPDKIANTLSEAHGKSFSIREYSRTVAETRYFGSEFSSDDSYYAPQLVFGSDPRGRKGFANSCNITLRGRGKAFLDDDAYAHFMGNSFLKMEGTSRIIGRNDGDLLVEHGKTILGQTPSGTVPQSTYLIDKYAGYDYMFVIDHGALLLVEQGARAKFSDTSSTKVEGHAWISATNESRLDLSGYSRIAARTYYSDVNNSLLLENHGMTFQSRYDQKANYTDDTFISNPNVVPAIKASSFLDSYYPTLDSVPTLSYVAQYIPINTRLQTFTPLFDNSIVFIKMVYAKQNTNLTTLNNELHEVFPEYTIDDYYLLNASQLTNLLQFFQNAPAAAEAVPDFFTRDFYYLTKAEWNTLYNNFPSAPVRYYTSIRSLQPLDVKQAYNFKSNVIDKLNQLSMFNIDCVQYNYNSTYIFYDSITTSSIPSEKSGTEFVLKKTESEPRLSNPTKYTTYDLNQWFNDKSYYVGKAGDYSPSVPNSGYYYLNNIKTNVNKNYAIGSLFRIEGPDTAFNMGSSGSGRENVRIVSGSDAYINLDISAGDYSNTMLKLGANANGNLELYITGDDAFFEIADRSHFEIHDRATVILAGDAPMNRDNTKVGHRGEFWTAPYFPEDVGVDNAPNAPTLQLYQNSQFVMYGDALSDVSNSYTNALSSTMYFNIKISIETLNALALQAAYEDGAQYLIDYLYNGNQAPGSRYDTIAVTDYDEATQIFKIFIDTQSIYVSSSYSDQTKYKKTFEAMAPQIDFTASNETYSDITGVIDGTPKCKLEITQVNYSTQDGSSCNFSLRVTNFLVGLNKAMSPRAKKQSASPLAEFADNSEFRIWGNIVFKIDDNGITIKDDSVDTAYTFTVADLKTAIEGGGGPSYPDAEDIQV